MERVRHPRYGELNVVNLSSEVKRIWYTRDIEPEPCEPLNVYYPTHTDVDLPDIQDFARRLVEATPLTDQEEMVICMCVIDNCTLQEAGKELDKSTERIRQILMKGLRRFRTHQKKLTGIDIWDLDTRVMPWFWWKHERKNNAAN